jgi:hypothetical protein
MNSTETPPSFLRDAVPTEEDVPEFLEQVEKLLSSEAIISETCGEVTDEIGERCYSLVSGRAVFGIQLTETDHSYVVALPALLAGSDEDVKGVPYCKQDIVELPRTAVILKSLVDQEFRYFYYKYLLNNTDKVPGFFSPERKQKLIREVSLWEGPVAEPTLTIRPQRFDAEESSQSRQILVHSMYPYKNRTKH